jgi:hypothetical protein
MKISPIRIIAFIVLVSQNMEYYSIFHIEMLCGYIAFARTCFLREVKLRNNILAQYFRTQIL